MDVYKSHSLWCLFFSQSVLYFFIFLFFNQDLLDFPSGCLLTRLVLPDYLTAQWGRLASEHTVSLIALHAEPCHFLQITITDTAAGLSVPHRLFAHLFPSISFNATPAISPSPLHPHFPTLPLPFLFFLSFSPLYFITWIPFYCSYSLFLLIFSSQTVGQALWLTVCEFICLCEWMHLYIHN